MKRVLFVNRFYWPETPATGQLLTDLAEGLAADGWHVTVITGRSGASPAHETRRGVEIVRLRGAEQSSSTWAKLVTFVRFGIGALLATARHVRRSDVAVCLSDPPLLGVAVGFVARLRGAHVIHWAHDIYPEVAVAVSGQRWLEILRPLRNLAWRSADRVVTLGPMMGALVEAGGVAPSRIHLRPNWAPAGLAPVAPGDPDVTRLRAQWNLQGKRVIGYSGNLGRVHELDLILKLAGELRHAPDIVFLFIGGGAQRERLERQVAEAGLGNVTFVPAQPREQLAASLGVADVHLVTLKQGCEAVVYPSKLYGIAAAGRPVVFLGATKSDVAAAVRENGMGLALDGRDVPADAAALSAFVRDDAARITAGRSALAFANRTSFAVSLSHWKRILHDVAPPTPVVPSP